MKGKLKVDRKLKVITYKITDFEEPISKDTLVYLKSNMMGDFTLITNAGVEIHSTEMKNGKWNGITIKRLKTKNK
jgi:hypothetical protein